jgi:hypothetical protein
MRLLRTLSIALAAAALLCAPARADNQSTVVMPTTGPMSMSTYSGTYLNPALLALFTCHIGSSAPANGPSSAAALGQCWWDTSGGATSYVLKYYDGASFVAAFTLNTSAHTITLSSAQPLDSDLTALANNSTNGIWARTGTGTGSARTIAGTANQITVTNGDGVSGNPTISIPSSPTIPGHPTIEGVTSTGATGTGNLVFSAAPTITGHPTIEGVTSTGATGTGNFVFSAAPTITGHPTIEGVTSTGATGTGNLVFSAAPTITGHPTVEGVTSTGATGTGKFVFDTSPAIAGGSLDNATVGATTAASGKFTSLEATQSVSWSGDVTPAQITSDQNNYTATNGGASCSNRTVLLLSTDASRTLTGLSCGQAVGEVRIIQNIGAQNLVLANASGSSTAGNRFEMGADVTVGAGSAMGFRYSNDGSNSRWRPLGGSGSGGGGGGGVTSITAGSGLTGGTITTSGTITAKWSRQFMFMN